MKAYPKTLRRVVGVGVGVGVWFLFGRGLRHHGSNYMLFDGVTSVFGTLGMAK